MDISSVADGVRWLLVLIFLLAGFEKAGRLQSGMVTSHPVIRSWTLFMRYPRVVMTTSFLSDVAACGLLVATPGAGGAAAIGLLLTYSIAGLGVRDESLTADESDRGRACNCLPAALETSSRRALVTRNSVLLSLSVIVVAVSPTPSIAGALWTILLLGPLSGLVAAFEGKGASGATAFQGRSFTPFPSPKTGSAR